jgi:hypothetical protein
MKDNNTEDTTKRLKTLIKEAESYFSSFNRVYTDTDILSYVIDELELLYDRTLSNEEVKQVISTISGD